jgi:hypothetical protein
VCRLVYDALPPFFDMMLVAHVMNSGLADSVDFIEGAASFRKFGDKVCMYVCVCHLLYYTLSAPIPVYQYTLPPTLRGCLSWLAVLLHPPPYNPPYKALLFAGLGKVSNPRTVFRQDMLNEELLKKVQKTTISIPHLPIKPTLFILFYLLNPLYIIN